MSNSICQLRTLILQPTTYTASEDNKISTRYCKQRISSTIPIRDGVGPKAGENKVFCTFDLRTQIRFVRTLNQMTTSTCLSTHNLLAHVQIHVVVGNNIQHAFQQIGLRKGASKLLWHLLESATLQRAARNRRREDNWVWRYSSGENGHISRIWDGHSSATTVQV